MKASGRKETLDNGNAVAVTIAEDKSFAIIEFWRNLEEDESKDINIIREHNSKFVFQVEEGQLHTSVKLSVDALNMLLAIGLNQVNNKIKTTYPLAS